MENIILDGEMLNLTSLTIEQLKEILDKIDTEELVVKQKIDNILEKLA